MLAESVPVLSFRQFLICAFYKGICKNFSERSGLACPVTVEHDYAENAPQSAQTFRLQEWVCVANRGNAAELVYRTFIA